MEDLHIKHALHMNTHHTKQSVDECLQGHEQALGSVRLFRTMVCSPWVKEDGDDGIHYISGALAIIFDIMYESGKIILSHHS